LCLQFCRKLTSRHGELWFENIISIARCQSPAFWWASRWISVEFFWLLPGIYVQIDCRGYNHVPSIYVMCFSYLWGSFCIPQPDMRRITSSWPSHSVYHKNLEKRQNSYKQMALVNLLAKVLFLWMCTSCCYLVWS
jgi:hypothetical protein